MIEVEYKLLNGDIVTKNRTLDGDPFSYKENFISQSEEEPAGMFKVIKAEKSKLTLEQIECDPVHWKGDRGGEGMGPVTNAKKDADFMIIAQSRCI